MNLVKALASILVVVTLTGCASSNWEPKPDRMARADADRPETASGAAAANLLYVPGRAIVCGASAVIAFAVMAITFGNDYEGASEMMHGGCSGPWQLQPADVR